MKIIHVFWGLTVGGIENMLTDIVNRQVYLHQAQIIIVNDLYDEELVARIDSRCEVFFLGRKKGSKSPLFILKMNKIIKETNPDIIHYHAAELKRFVWIPHRSMITIHNTHLPTIYYSKRDTLVSISKAVHADVLDKSGFDSVIIENGIDIPSIRTRNERNNNPFRMVQIGRLYIEQKGQDLLITALEQLVYQEGMTQLRLDFIGDGESREYLENMVSEKKLNAYITFLGNKDRSYIYTHLKDYNLFIQPSRFEGFGLTVVEAMAAQIPVLVSNNEGPMEIIQHGKYGYFFENEDPTDCARCIREIYCHYPEINKLENHRQHIIRNYSIDNLVQQYDTLYSHMVSSKKK